MKWLFWAIGGFIVYSVLFARKNGTALARTTAPVDPGKLSTVQSTSAGVTGPGVPVGGGATSIVAPSKPKLQPGEGGGIVLASNNVAMTGPKVPVTKPVPQKPSYSCESAVGGLGMRWVLRKIVGAKTTSNPTGMFNQWQCIK